MSNKANSIIEHLKMQRIPHEGSWFTLSYTNSLFIPQAVLGEHYASFRPASSAILALVTREDFSALHRLVSDELWHYYDGSSLELLLLYPDGSSSLKILGPDVLNDEKPQITVKRGTWMGARPATATTESYTLFGCTLSPGFEYSDFELAERLALQKLYPDRTLLIEKLTR